MAAVSSSGEAYSVIFFEMSKLLWSRASFRDYKKKGKGKEKKRKGERKEGGERMETAC